MKFTGIAYHPIIICVPICSFNVYKYRLEIKHESFHGFRNRDKVKVSKPRRTECTVANLLIINMVQSRVHNIMYSWFNATGNQLLI